MATKPHTYTPHAPYTDPGLNIRLVYTGGDDAGPMNPGRGQTVTVDRYQGETRAELGLYALQYGVELSVKVPLGAADLRRLAHRLLDAAADIEAEAAQAAAQEVAA